MSSQIIPCEESMFREQPPNLKQHSGVVDGSQSIFKIDYAPYLGKWFSRHITSRNGGTDQELILVNVYNLQTRITYEWCRPDLQAIIADKKLMKIEQLLKEDILNYLL
jgi:hypothetical protein